MMESPPSASTPPDIKRARLDPAVVLADFRRRLSKAFVARAARRMSETTPTAASTSTADNAPQSGVVPAVPVAPVCEFRSGIATNLPSALGLSIADKAVPLPFVPSALAYELLACCQPVVVRQSSNNDADFATCVSQARSDLVYINNSAFSSAVHELAVTAAGALYGGRLDDPDGRSPPPRWRCQFLRLLALEAGCVAQHAAAAVGVGDVSVADDLVDACRNGSSVGSPQPPTALLLIRPPSLLAGGRLSVSGRSLEPATLTTQPESSHNSTILFDDGMDSGADAVETFQCSYACLPCGESGCLVKIDMEPIKSGCQLLLQYVVVADGLRGSPLRQQRQVTPTRPPPMPTPPREDINELLRNMAEEDFPAVRIVWALRGRYTTEQMARDGGAALQGEDRHVLHLLQEEWPNSRTKLECFIALLQPDWRRRRQIARRQQRQQLQAAAGAASHAAVPLLIEVAAADGNSDAAAAMTSAGRLAQSQQMTLPIVRSEAASAALAGTGGPPITATELAAFKHFYSLDGALFEYVCGMRVSELLLEPDELMNGDAETMAVTVDPNTGTFVDRFAIVAWPADRSFDLARGCGLNALVSLTLHFGRRCHPGLPRVMRCLLDSVANETDWPKFQHPLRPPADCELLRVIGQLGDASLANRFLGDVLARQFRTRSGLVTCFGVRSAATAERIYGLACRFGWAALESSLMRLIQALPAVSLSYLARWCPSLEEALSSCESNALPKPLAELLNRSLDAQSRVNSISGQEQQQQQLSGSDGADNPIVRFGLQCLLACEQESLCRRLVDFVDKNVSDSGKFIAKSLRCFLAGRSRQSNGGKRLLCTLVESLLQSAENQYRIGELRLSMAQSNWSYLSQRSLANEKLAELIDFLHAVQSEPLWHRFLRLIESLGQPRHSATDDDRRHLQLAYANLLRDLAERILLNNFHTDSHTCRQLLKMRQHQLIESLRPGEPEFSWRQPWIPDSPQLQSVVAFLRGPNQDHVEEFGTKTEARNFADLVTGLAGKYANATADGTGRQAHVMVRKRDTAHEEEVVRRYYADLAELARLTMRSDGCYGNQDRRAASPGEQESNGGVVGNANNSVSFD